jgi:hypothetical protein
VGDQSPTDPGFTIRKGQGSAKLTKEEFSRRLREHFYDPQFDALSTEIDRIVDVAWTAYDEYRKSPRTRAAGAEFADPDYQLPIEWLETRARIKDAEAQQRRPDSRSRVLLICASPRAMTRVRARCRKPSG